MQVLVLGNGAHTKKRIVPALKKIPFIESILVADRNARKVNKMDDVLSIVNYQEVFKLSINFDLAIIATPPNNHIESLKKINGKSRNILIEKPISNNINVIRSNEFKAIYENGSVFESIMYFHHPLWKKVQTIVNDIDIKEIYTEFSVPHQSLDGFRYKKKMGGGSLNDQGIYPISLITELFSQNYDVKSIQIFKDKDYEVDLGGKLNLSIKNINVFSQWGLGKDYKNYLIIKDTADNEYKFDFIFSKPDNLNAKIIFSNNKEIKVGVYDQFELMYRAILESNVSEFKYSKYDNLFRRYNLLKEVSNFF